LPERCAGVAASAYQAPIVHVDGERLEALSPPAGGDHAQGVLRALLPAPASVLLAVVVIPYVVALGLGPRRLAHVPLPSCCARALALAVSEVTHEAVEDPRVSTASGPLLAVWLLAPPLALIVAGSAGMVAAALAVARAWHIPQSLVGTLAAGTGERGGGTVMDCVHGFSGGFRLRVTRHRCPLHHAAEEERDAPGRDAGGTIA
jgi:hypothetical protein